ncbi:hypothetical protein [Kangiella geojedonensis]|uniref:Uncharacterized protein n=1 Tax=Kangiella geojedonensis TaxID=914150 RepID=A0A0F6TRV8_9GAMM|nr:hypothetical protein [Kangiella geojedonensis]AKE52517.1 hypothetical protein TQ33_1572 [Kangiella geojedonensis]
MALIVEATVWLFALGLIAFEFVILLAKPKAIQFLKAFVKTPWHHFLEQTLRLIIGASIVVHAPDMAFSDLFGIFGWIIIITSLMLVGLPWRWHHTFAKKVIPTVIKFIQLYGILCLALGSFTIYSLA